MTQQEGMDAQLVGGLENEVLDNTLWGNSHESARRSCLTHQLIDPVAVID